MKILTATHPASRGSGPVKLADDQDGECDDVAGTWEDIAMAMSASYTPAAGDDGDCLQATATYTDPAKGDIEDNADTPDVDESRPNPASGVTEMPVEIKPAFNSAPKFPDEEKPDGADPIEMEEDENTDGTLLTVTAADVDLLIYELGGADAGTFDIVAMGPGEGEISVAEGAKLDYETQTSYSFSATATDPSGADDTVMVTITLMDVDEPPVPATVVPENNPPTFADDAVTDFMVYENMDAGAAVGTVTASDDDVGDTLTYSDDSGYFDVDGDGNITTTMTLDHEAMASHSVTVTATDDEEDDATASMVTVNGR